MWTSRFGRLALPGRALDYLTFYMSAGVRLLGMCRRGEVVVAETDPPRSSRSSPPLPCLEGLVVPSKFYGIAAAGRPVLFVGDPAGQIARLVEDSGCGHGVAAGRAEEVARRIVAPTGDVSRIGAPRRSATPCRRARLEVVPSTKRGR